MGRITFSLKFFEMVILSPLWTSPAETESSAACSPPPGTSGSCSRVLPLTGCDAGQRLRLLGPRPPPHRPTRDWTGTFEALPGLRYQEELMKEQRGEKGRDQDVSSDS